MSDPLWYAKVILRPFWDAVTWLPRVAWWAFVTRPIRVARRRESTAAHDAIQTEMWRRTMAAMEPDDTYNNRPLSALRLPPSAFDDAEWEKVFDAVRCNCPACVSRRGVLPSRSDVRYATIDELTA